MALIEMFPDRELFDTIMAQRIGYIRFIGTHDQYDQIDVEVI